MSQQITMLSGGRRVITPLEQFLSPPPSFQLIGPTISILIPYFNYGKYVSACIDSILKCSSLERLLTEVIIIDNGSTNCRDIAILHGQAQRLEGQVRNLIIHRNEKGLPLGYVRNQGAIMANGDFYCWVDPDDEVVSGRFDFTLQAALSNLGQKIIYGDAWAKNEISIAYMQSKQINFSQLLEGCCIYCQSTLMPRWMYMALGGQTDLKIAEDYEFWLRAAGIGIEFQHLSTPIYIARNHQNNKTKYDMAMVEAWHKTHNDIREAAKAIASEETPFIAVRSRFARTVHLACGRMVSSRHKKAPNARIFIDFEVDECPHMPNIVPIAIWEAWRDIESRHKQGESYSDNLEKGYSASAQATVMFNFNDIGKWRPNIYRECDLSASK